MPFVRDLVVAAVLGMALLFAGGDVAAANHVSGREPLTVDDTSPTGARASTPPGRVRPDDMVRVDLTRAIGPVNQNLTGVVWNAGGSIAPLAPVHPAIVRIDASLESRSQGPGQLDLQPLLNRVAQVRAIGAEPLVILSYMPRWLGEPRSTVGQDPDR